jgi:hypothetical protein
MTTGRLSVPTARQFRDAILHSYLKTRPDRGAKNDLAPQTHQAVTSSHGGGGAKWKIAPRG